ncbi:MAG: flagellar basal body L-ring protein, partial [Halocynthiibacter sp.]
MKIIRLVSAFTIIALLAACSAAERLTLIGQAPPLSAIENPTAQVGYRPVIMPMPEPIIASYQANSLFRTDARGFFKDQRARRIGDI